MGTYFSWERKTFRSRRNFFSQKKEMGLFSFKVFSSSSSSFLMQRFCFVAFVPIESEFFFFAFQDKIYSRSFSPIEFSVFVSFLVLLYFRFVEQNCFFDLPKAWRESPPKNVFVISEANPFIDFKRRKKFHRNKIIQIGFSLKNLYIISIG